MAAIFERQWLHALALFVMLPTLWLISINCVCFHHGELWGYQHLELVLDLG